MVKCFMKLKILETEYSIRCIGMLFSKLQGTWTTIKYVLLMMVPRVIEIFIIIYSWKYTFGKERIS